MRQRVVHPVLAALGCFGLGASSHAQTEAAAIVEVDATDEGVPLVPVWSYFGYDEVNYTTVPEGRALLRTLAEANEARVHVRTHFLFNSGDGSPSLKWGSTNLYTEDDQGSPVFDFTIIDQIMDAKLDAGVLPLFQLGFMPEALSVSPTPYENSSPFVIDGGSHYPPADYDKWAALVSTWAEHVKERYPDAERTWQWELWNEPDIAYFQGTFEEYARLYDFTEAALHGVFPDAPLGGPAIARPGEGFLSRFLEHCETGENAVTGEQGTRLDLVTFHAKGGTTLIDRNVQMDLGNQLRLHQAGFEEIAASGFSRAPVVISEADPDGCAACTSTTAHHLDYRNFPAYGAYEVATMKRSLDLAARMDIDLRGVLTWAFTFPDSPYFHGYRALATNGIALPVLNAFKLLGSLNGRRIPARSSAALSLDELLASGVRERPDVDVLATSEGDLVQILVWHYHDLLAPADPIRVTLEVSLPAAFEDGALVTHSRVDDAHGNAHAVWVDQGSPESPSAAQLEELREAADSLEFEPEWVVPVSDGKVDFAFALPRFGISLFTLEPSSLKKARASTREGPLQDGGGCSCWSLPTRRSTPPVLFVLSLATALALRRFTTGWTRKPHSMSA